MKCLNNIHERIEENKRKQKQRKNTRIEWNKGGTDRK